LKLWLSKGRLGVPEGGAGYPYNFKKIGYRLQLASAGFSPEALLIRVERHVLGIRHPIIERRFRLADFIEVKGQSSPTELCQSIFLRQPLVAKAPCRIAIATTIVE
jgi:hypothetical protein